jgi:hypothetical protein
MEDKSIWHVALGHLFGVCDNDPEANTYSVSFSQAHSAFRGITITFKPQTVMHR